MVNMAVLAFERKIIAYKALQPVTIADPSEWHNGEKPSHPLPSHRAPNVNEARDPLHD